MGHRELGKLDWSKIKENPVLWRQLLYDTTKRALTCSSKVQLSDYNESGYFHLVRNKEHYEKMRSDWGKEESVPEHWISKGEYGGIWTALFDPVNTYSNAYRPINIIRFYFEDDYYVFDTMNNDHSELNNNGKLSLLRNLFNKNRWDFLKDDDGLRLSKKIGYLGCPRNKKFYEENNFGAVIGYHDYISPVIVLEDSVESVEFLDDL